MIRKLTLALLLTLPTMAIDLDGYYIIAKGSFSKTMDTGTTHFNTIGGDLRTLQNEDLGTEQLSLDVNYQYVNLGVFKGGTGSYENGAFTGNIQRGINGGDIKTQELMVGLQYTFK